MGLWVALSVLSWSGKDIRIILEDDSGMIQPALHKNNICHDCNLLKLQIIDIFHVAKMELLWTQFKV